MDWSTLGPVIVGGAIGIIGTLVGPTLTTWLNDETAKKKQRVEKFAELIAIIYEHEHWLDMYRGVTVWGTEMTLGPSPLPRAIAIAAIHFPQFNARLDELSSETSKYQYWMLEAAQRRLANKLSEVGEGFRAAYDPFRLKHLQVLDELKKFAAIEFGQ